MPKPLNSAVPSDISLLLRADAEQRWLNSEVIPVLHHIESDQDLDAEEVGAALAYLEAMWNEAGIRARHTDVAHLHLGSEEKPEELSYAAGRYHAAVRVLRDVIAQRVVPLVSSLQKDVELSENGSAALRMSDPCPSEGGRTPRAA